MIFVLVSTLMVLSVCVTNTKADQICIYGLYDNPLQYANFTNEIFWLEKEIGVENPIEGITICTNIFLKQYFEESSLVLSVASNLISGFNRAGLFIFGDNTTLQFDTLIPFYSWIHICFVYGNVAGAYIDGVPHVSEIPNPLKLEDRFILNLGASNKLFDTEYIATPRMLFTLPQIFLKQITQEEALNLSLCNNTSPESDVEDSSWHFRTQRLSSLLVISTIDPTLSTQPPSETVSGNCNVAWGSIASDTNLGSSTNQKLNIWKKLISPFYTNESLDNVELDMFPEIVGKFKISEKILKEGVNFLGVFSINVTDKMNLCSTQETTRLFHLEADFSLKPQEKMCKLLGGNLLEWNGEDSKHKVLKYINARKVKKMYARVISPEMKQCTVMWYIDSEFQILKIPCNDSSPLTLLCELPSVSNYRLRQSQDDMVLHTSQTKPFVDTLYFLAPAAEEFDFVSRYGDRIYFKFFSYKLMNRLGHSYTVPFTGGNVLGRFQWVDENQPDNSILMSFTTCTDDQFTCDTGDCISLKNRCDGTDDCPDASDEICRMVVNDASKSLRPPSSNTPITFSLKTIWIEEVITEKNLFKLRFDMKYSWFDSRVEFSQLHSRTGNNLIRDVSYVPKMLFPTAFYADSVAYENGKTSIPKLFALKKTSVPPSVVDSREAYIYNAGGSARVIKQEGLLLNFYCGFQLFLFPFDVQKCQLTIRIVNTGTKHVYFNSSEIRLVSTKHSLNIFDSSPLKLQTSNLNVSRPTELHFHFLLSRRFGSYILTHVVPCMLIGLLGSLSHFFEVEDFQNRIMVTLSCLIVLASLFSQMTSSLAQSASPKTLEIVFFYYIVRLSTIFVIHTCICMHRSYRLSKRTLSGKILRHPLIQGSRKVAAKADWMYPKLNDVPPMIDYEIINKYSFWLEQIFDFFFVTGATLYVVGERNRILSSYEKYREF